MVTQSTTPPERFTANIAPGENLFSGFAVHDQRELPTETIPPRAWEKMREAFSVMVSRGILSIEDRTAFEQRALGDGNNAAPTFVGVISRALVDKLISNSEVRDFLSASPASYQRLENIISVRRSLDALYVAEMIDEKQKEVMSKYYERIISPIVENYVSEVSQLRIGGVINDAELRYYAAIPVAQMESRLQEINVGIGLQQLFSQLSSRAQLDGSVKVFLQPGDLESDAQKGEPANQNQGLWQRIKDTQSLCYERAALEIAIPYPAEIARTLKPSPATTVIRHRA